MNIVILAAGMGKRMHSKLPKVLQPLAGKPMLDWVLERVQPLSKSPVVVVIGHQADMVQAHYAEKRVFRLHYKVSKKERVMPCNRLYHISILLIHIPWCAWEMFRFF